MKNLKLALLSFLTKFYAAFGAYDENFARYYTWPMAAATTGDSAKCVKDNFANSTVRK